LVAGILSGLLSAEVARLLDPGNPLLGGVFGVAMLLLVWVKHKRCSLWRAVVLITSSIAAYFVSIWATLFLSALLDRILGRESSFTDLVGPGMFAVAGFLGALVFNSALLLLFSPGRKLRLLGKAAAWSCAGAFLGFLGSELREPMGAAVAAVVGEPPSPAMGDNHYYVACYSAYLIWQTGMACVIPLMLPHGVLYGSD
jgi:hypothetical protein